jgi:hypothetical protein
MPISGVNLTPRPTAVYASDPALPRRPQDSLPSCLLGFERTRLALASSYQLPIAPRTGLLSKVRRDRHSGLGRPIQFRSVGSGRRGHADSGSVSGACVGIVLSSRPGPFPPHPPPPLLAALFGVSSVLWTRPTPPTFRSGFGSSPSRTDPEPPWRLRAVGGLPGSDAIPSSVMWPQTPAGRRCLA